MRIKAFLALCMLLFITACGQKGALVLTPTPSPEIQQAPIKSTPQSESDGENKSVTPPNEEIDQ